MATEVGTLVGLGEREEAVDGTEHMVGGQLGVASSVKVKRNLLLKKKNNGESKNNRCSLIPHLFFY